MKQNNKQRREIIGVIGNDTSNHLINYDTNKYYDDSFVLDLSLENNSHSLICRRVKKNSTVLDVGCAQGMIGKALNEQLSCKVYGIEIDEDAKKKAEQSGCYSGVFLFDITAPQGKDYNKFKQVKEKFDYIIFADVLEHLIHPEKVLAEYSKLLNDGGKILISIPNIAHYDIIDGLMNGKFNYARMGILDNTHLRFFTKNSFIEFIDLINKKFDCGFKCECFASTFFKPDFWGKYETLDRVMAESPDACALQHLFELSITNSDWENKKPKAHNLTKKIEEEFQKIEAQNRALDSQNRALQVENNKLQHAQSELINSASWKITSPLRKIMKPVHEISSGMQRITRRIACRTEHQKPAIMFFVHTWINLGGTKLTDVGGTTLNTLDIIAEIKNMYDCYVVTAIGNEYVLVSFDECGNQNIYALDIPIATGDYDEYNSDFYLRISNLLDELQIDILHIQHIWNFPCDLGLLAAKRKTILTIHDYAFFRPKEQAFVVTCERETSLSSARREAMAVLLQNADSIVVPSRTIREELLSRYPDLEAKTKIVANGIYSDKMIIKKPYKREKNKKDFNIAFVGVIDGHKGYKNILSLIKTTDDQNIKYHLFGVTGHKELNNYKNFTNHGRYQREALPGLLNKYEIDLVCFLGDCRESFSYALSEVLYAGVPVFSFDLGAIGERIKASGAGWTIEYTKDMKTVLKFISEKIKSKEYQEKLRAAEDTKVQTVDGMVKDLLTFYDCNIAGKDLVQKYRCLDNLRLIRTIKNNKRRI